MFTITDIASEKAKEYLVAEDKAGWGVRIFTAGGGCCGPSYGMDLDEKSKDGDEVIEHNGLKVFADAETFGQLQDKKLDFIEQGEQQGFVIQPLVQQNDEPSCASGCSSC